MNQLAQKGDTPVGEPVITCGIIMPISHTEGYSQRHWQEVLSILTDTASSLGFNARLVSQAQEVAIIQKTIVQNIYFDNIVICDVSSKNPNVMLELGMRLAFDKPVVIVKDDITDYSFDTSPLEHIGYPSTLRFPDIIELKDRLADKLKATLESQNTSSFLKAFGQFKVAKLETVDVGRDELILDEIRALRESLGPGRTETKERIAFSYTAIEVTRDQYDIFLEEVRSIYEPAGFGILSSYDSIRNRGHVGVTSATKQINSTKANEILGKILLSIRASNPSN